MDLNKYVFEVTTESFATHEVESTDVVFFEVTPHEAWKRVGEVLSNIEEHASVILSVKLI